MPRRQVSKVSLHESRCNKLHIRQLQHDLSKYPRGGNEHTDGIVRPVPEDQAGLFNDMNEALRVVSNGTFIPSEHKSLGVAVFTPYEMQMVRRRAASKLGALSIDCMENLALKALPDSARHTTQVKLGHLIVSKFNPQRDTRTVVLTIPEPETMVTERTDITKAVDEHEQFEHDWPVYRPHLTLGRIPRKISDSYARVVERAGINLIEEYNSLYLAPVAGMETTNQPNSSS